MICTQCDKPYDADRNPPKLLPKCGHCICANCLTKLCSTSFPDFKCPFDNLQYSKNQEFMDNLYIIEQIKKSQSSANSCPKHGKDMEIFCNDCSVVICTDCALFDGHKMHEVEQLHAVRGKSEAKLQKYRKKITELQTSLAVEAKDFNMAIQRLRNEKLEQIDINFKELKNVLDENQKRLSGSVSSFYDSITSSFSLFKNKLKELETKIFSSTIEKEMEKNPLFDREFLKDLQEIDTLISSRNLLSSPAEQRKLLEITFDKSLGKKLVAFCKISCRPPSTKSSNNISQENVNCFENLNNEENLLQESFKDLIKNAADSLMKDEQNFTIEESHRQRNPHASPKPTTSQYISELKNYSPISVFSNISGQNYKGKEERSLLSRKKETNQNTISNNNSIASNPFTTKKSMNNFIGADSESLRNAEITSNARNKVTFGPSGDGISVKSGNSKRLDYHDKENQRVGGYNDRISSAFDAVMRSKSDTLDLSNCCLDDKAVEGIARKLAQTRNVKTLKLNCNTITEVGLKTILRSIKELSIEYIYLTENALKDTALDYLISFKKYNSCLKAVYMANNSFNKSSAKLKMKVKILDEANIVAVV